MEILNKSELLQDKITYRRKEVKLKKGLMFIDSLNTQESRGLMMILVNMKYDLPDYQTMTEWILNGEKLNNCDRVVITTQDHLRGAFEFSKDKVWFRSIERSQKIKELKEFLEIVRNEYTISIDDIVPEYHYYHKGKIQTYEDIKKNRLYVYGLNDITEMTTQIVISDELRGPITKLILETLINNGLISKSVY